MSLPLGLTACEGSEPTAQATEDACYQEQAEAYESAARLAESTIQENMPVIVGASADMLAAGIARDRLALQSAHDTFSHASERMQLAGKDFGLTMDRANSLCS